MYVHEGLAGTPICERMTSDDAPLVWNQVKEMVQNPELIVAGIESLDAHDDSGLADRIASAERDLQKVQVEEKRAIRLYVSGKITEDQLDQQRRFITERLEAARAALNDLRARESMASEKRLLMENLIEWAGRFGRGLDDLPKEKRRDVLRLLVDQVLIDRDNNVSITLGIPTENLTSFETEESRVPGSGVRGRGSGERETTASSLAGKQQAREKEDNGGQGKDGPAGAIAQGGNGR